MRSLLRLRLFTYLLTLVLLGTLCGLFHQFRVKAWNASSTLVDDEISESELFRDIENENPPVHFWKVEDVRWVFHVKDHDERMEKRRRYLIHVGSKAFPAYEAILSDPKSDFMEVVGVFGVLCDVKADRRRFIKHVLSRLTDSDYRIRVFALPLLECIGSSTEASPVVALLSDERLEVSYASAKTLIAIGGPNEVLAIDIWLRGASHRDDRELREHVRKCRDELKKRLDAKKGPKK